jgi:cytidine deaminase
MSKAIPDSLIEKARAARKQSHAPFSKFRVGAAVRTRSGRIFTGSNVESSSYGLTICAERLAICFAVHEGHSDITEIALVADTKGAPGPCGACRQFMFDFAPQASVLMENLKGDSRQVQVKELIPWGFGPADLLDREPTHDEEGSNDHD